jgi:hypothetical protein
VSQHHAPFASGGPKPGACTARDVVFYGCYKMPEIIDLRRQMSCVGSAFWTFQPGLVVLLWPVLREPIMAAAYGRAKLLSSQLKNKERGRRDQGPTDTIRDMTLIVPPFKGSTTSRQCHSRNKTLTHGSLGDSQHQTIAGEQRVFPTSREAASSRRNEPSSLSTMTLNGRLESKSTRQKQSS